MNSFYTRDELADLGLAAYGEDVFISRKASIYGAENIRLGDHVRIDDYCILSGKVTVGNYVHIAAYTALFGGEAGIGMADYTCLSSRCAVYAVSDDYSGESMSNPMVPKSLRNVRSKPVILRRHVLVGTGCTILPGVELGEGAAVGSMSLVNRSLAPWGIYAGIPACYLKERSKGLLQKEKLLREQEERKNPSRGGVIKRFDCRCAAVLRKEDAA